MDKIKVENRENPGEIKGNILARVFPDVPRDKLSGWGVEIEGVQIHAMASSWSIPPKFTGIQLSVRDERYRFVCRRVMLKLSNFEIDPQAIKDKFEELRAIGKRAKDSREQRHGEEQERYLRVKKLESEVMLNGSDRLSSGDIGTYSLILHVLTEHQVREVVSLINRLRIEPQRS